MTLRTVRFYTKEACLWLVRIISMTQFKECLSVNEVKIQGSNHEVTFILIKGELVALFHVCFFEDVVFKLVLDEDLTVNPDNLNMTSLCVALLRIIDNIVPLLMAFFRFSVRSQFVQFIH